MIGKVLIELRASVNCADSALSVKRMRCRELEIWTGLVPVASALLELQ